MSEQYIVGRFFLKDRRDRPGQQLQCYLGIRGMGNLYVIDRNLSPIPESAVKEGAFYYCGISQTLVQNDHLSVFTVAVLEEIDFSKGIFVIDPNRNQWQSHMTSKNNMSYTFVIDTDCQKVPRVIGESWTFKVRRIVSVYEDSIVMSVILDEPVVSDRAKRRHGILPSAKKEEVTA
ncbi:MAG: hypothetical protein WCR40_01190 [Candidatus Paceibacterota bacterium]